MPRTAKSCRFLHSFKTFLAVYGDLQRVCDCDVLQCLMFIFRLLMLRVHNSPLSGFIVLFLSSAVSYSAYAASQWCYQCVLLLYAQAQSSPNTSTCTVYANACTCTSMCVHKTLQIVHVCIFCLTSQLVVQLRVQICLLPYVKKTMMT